MRVWVKNCPSPTWRRTIYYWADSGPCIRSRASVLARGPVHVGDANLTVVMSYLFSPIFFPFVFPLSVYISYHHLLYLVTMLSFITSGYPLIICTPRNGDIVRLSIYYISSSSRSLVPQSFYSRLRLVLFLSFLRCVVYWQYVVYLFL